MSVKVRLSDEPPWYPERSNNPMSREQIDLIREAEFGRGMQAGLKSLNASLESLNHFNSSDLLSDATDLIDARLNKSKAKSMTHVVSLLSQWQTQTAGGSSQDIHCFGP